MKAEEFLEAEVIRLGMNYNKTFSNDQMQLISDQLKRIRNRDFIRGCINDLISEYRYWPSPNQIKEMVNWYIDQYKITGKKLQKCDKCTDEGFMLIENFAYRCSCELGQSLSRHIPDYKSSIIKKRKYETIKGNTAKETSFILPKD